MTSVNLNLNRSNFGDFGNLGNLLADEAALHLMVSWVPNPRLQLHMKQVAAIMKAWAVEKEKKDEITAKKWEQAGLLHDADWEKFPDQHCRVIIEELEKRQVDPEIIRCIACHGPRYFGVEPVTTMEKMIYVFDELSGFIHAASLIRPAGYEGMDAKSIKKKLKTSSFAAQVSRDDINDALSRIDYPLEEIIEFIILHQKNIT